MRLKKARFLKTKPCLLITDKKKGDRMAVNDSEKGRLRMFNLVTKLLEMVRDSKRDVNNVNRALQEIQDNPNFIQRFFPEETLDLPLVKTKRRKALLKEWENFYQEAFGWKVDFSQLPIPAPKPGFDRLIVVAQGLTPNQIVTVLKKHMTVWQYTDNLDTIQSVRKTDQTYAIWVRDRQEADEELKNKSANDLKQENINCLTLEERLLFHLKYFLETGKHLDEKNRTLCAGSRSPDGNVPKVIWYDGKVDVSWCYPSLAYSSLRARSAVS